MTALSLTLLASTRSFAHDVGAEMASVANIFLNALTPEQKSAPNSAATLNRHALHADFLSTFMMTPRLFCWLLRNDDCRVHA